MWQAGLIYGFIERDQVALYVTVRMMTAVYVCTQVTRAVQHQDVGACLVRFSENHPGFFAVGYKIASENNDDDDDGAKVCVIIMCVRDALHTHTHVLRSLYDIT